MTLIKSIHKLLSLNLFIKKDKNQNGKEIRRKTGKIS